MLRELLDRSALVVAHPDDEVLWFSSVLDHVKSVFVCFLEAPGEDTWSAGRERVAASYPLSNVRFLGLTESMAFQACDWRNPEESPTGLRVERRPGTPTAFDAARYRDNYRRLRDTLEGALAGHSAVITHNPWGEYGHEEHVQVHRAVAEVAAAHDIALWYTTYCSNRSFRLMERHLRGRPADAEVLATDIELARRIETLYRDNACWTWPFDDYAYFPTECFVQADAALEPAPGPGASAVLNYLTVDPPRRAPVSAFRRRLRSWRRRLGAAGAGHA